VGKDIQMSLVVTTLKNNLKNCFDAMAGDTGGDNTTFAKKVSKAVADYVETGSITTVDAGTVSAGVFAGSGSGSISVQAGIAEAVIYAACQAMVNMTAGGNDYLAMQIATGIQQMMAAGEVSTNVTGLVTPPTGSAFTLTGQATGRTVCVQAPLYAGLKTAFTAMENMTEGGNEYMAAQMATVIDTYLKAGVVSTGGQAALSGSTGAGTLS
jgi:hypothetical protein